jgi:exonuclease SbcC
MKQRKALLEERRRWVQERDRLIEANGRKKSLDTRLDVWTREGQELAEALREGEGRIDAVAAEIERLSERCRRMEEAAAGTCPTCGQILTDEHRAQVLAQLEAERDDRVRAREAVQADCRGLAAQRDALRERYRADRSEAESLGPIAEALAGVEAQGQALEERIRESEAIEDRLAVVGDTLRREAFGERERAALDEALAAREALEIDERRLDEARAARTQLPWLEERTRTLDGLEEQERDTVETIARLANEGETLRREIERGEAMTALRVEQADWERRRDEVGFAPQAYEAVRQALRDVAQAGIELRELAEARERLPAWEEQRTRLDERLTTLREEASTLAARLAPMKTLHHALDTQQAQSAASRKKREALSDSLRERAVRNGELNARLERYAREREALETARALRAGIDHERTLYAHLRVAFGKNGIPSLIIEEALPELERRANTLLDRLTDGRLHVRLETLKDKKTGGTKETLEIILTDEQGVARPYETYSGGEAFRVNFALRIALSQLLAERQGVRVRTLGIDEGFGTQDEQGIQHMIEAIQAIADDFDKILVITHLDALKEAFPVRIEVEKHPVRGSLFHVVGI